MKSIFIIYVIFSVLTLVITIYTVIYLLLKKTLQETQNFKEKVSTKDEQYKENITSVEKLNTIPQEAVFTEVLYAAISDHFKEFNKKIVKLYEMLGSLTKAEIVNEIETIKIQIQKIEESIDRVKSEDRIKKEELKQQILTTLQFLNHMKELLQIDVETLTSQRDRLKKILHQQEIEYEHIVKNYNTEINNLNRMIEELKISYPEELLSKLRYEVSNKTEQLERIQRQYQELKTETTNKISFLDNILAQKSTQIQQFVSDIKNKNEQELFSLKNRIEELKQQTDLLNEQIKTVINNIYAQHQQKDEIVKQLNSELDELRNRKNEITMLKTREEFLISEINRLKKEYEELQREYKELTYKKAESIKELENYSERTITQLMDEWEQKKREYNIEIQRLTKRLDTLVKRREKLLKIQKKFSRQVKIEEKEYEQKILNTKIELEQKRSELETSIRKNITNLEICYQEFKQKVDETKKKLVEKIQKYNDIIVELKKRSDIREQRIQRNIAKAKSEYDNVITLLQQKVAYTEQETVSLSQQLTQQREDFERKTVAKKERLETFLMLLKDTEGKINSAKEELVKFEMETTSMEQRLVAQLDEIVDKVSKQKQLVIDRLEKLISEEEQVLLKTVDKSIENDETREIQKGEKLY